ncbi:hypothetical protein KKH27_09510 [bacterium]|nr:hypothetical protein [bacterium]
MNGLSMLQPVRIDDLSGTTDRLPSAAQAGIQIPIERASIRASTDASNATVEAEAPVYGSIFVNYRYSYPVSALQIASSGTHRLGFFVDLDRMPVLSSYPLMPALPPVQVEIRPLPAVPRGFTVVRASTDSVSKMRMNIRRSIEEGIHPRHLALLFPEDLGNLRASMNPTRLTELDLLDVRDPTLRLEGLYTPGYRGAVEGIGLLMTQADVPPRAELLTFSGGERRANALVNVMTGDRIAVKAHVPLYEAEWHPMSLAELESVTSTAQEVQELLYPDHVTFYPAAVFRTLRGSQWWLEIRNAREEIVNSFYGRNELPDSLAWDWRDQNDSVIAPGIYTYLLRIVNGQGETDFSQRGQLRVSYEHRSLAIDVTRKPRIGDKEADRYVIIVGSHGTAPPLPAENPPAP